MKKEEIHLWDIKRILFGQAPPEFMLEVLIRSIIIYVATIIIMRFLGKRMNGQLTILEYAVMVVMGATISVPMQIADRGLLQGFVVLRAKKIFQLGKVKRMYLEACGIFSIYEEEESKPGLPLFPPDDKSLLEQKTPVNTPVVCINCGTVKLENEEENNCRNCGNNEWTKAIV